MTDVLALCGRAFVFGDEISADVMAPGRYLKLSPPELAAHCLESVDPTFAANVQQGDIIVAGRNFGLGSSREQAAESLRLLGIRAIIAKSFARIFYRNAINLGLVALRCAEAGEIADRDIIRVDAGAGRIENLTASCTHAAEPLPPHVVAIIRDGGLIPHLKKRLARPSIPADPRAS